MSAALDHKSPVEIVGSFLESAPVDLAGMAQALGLSLQKNFGWSDNTSGSIERMGESYTIRINGNDSPTRARFTLAHEIAHYILHRDLIGDGITDDALYRSSLSNYIETQANQYAASLLMPARLMREKWRQGLRAIHEFASAFGVSSKAAEIRMKELRLG